MKKSLKEKEIMDIFKKYWYYAGVWHNESCSCLTSDEGVCNCKTARNRKDIVEELLKKKG